MNAEFNNAGLTPEQVKSLDEIGAANQAVLAGLHPNVRAMAEAFDEQTSLILQEYGIDTIDPKVFAGIVVGAAIMHELTHGALPGDITVGASGALVMNAIMADRPLLFPEPTE